MQLYPAIDIKQGKCVRLTQGRFQDVKIYSEDPVEMALAWENAGASFIHLVDLDGALKGRGVNREVISRIAAAVHIPVQLGGGIRTQEDMQEIFALGVSRGIIGTKAVESPAFIQKMLALYGPERLVIGVDASDGFVAVNGWEEVSCISATELVRQMGQMGIRTIVYTDISRDGMLKGPNVEGTATLARETGLEIIASGGVSSMEDLENLYRAGIDGVIIGKALYESRLDLHTAILRYEKGQTL